MRARTLACRSSRIRKWWGERRREAEPGDGDRREENARLIAKALGTFVMKRELVVRELCSLILAQCHDHPLRVAFDGVDAAGKTTLANEVELGLISSGRQIIRASIDGFHNPKAIRHRDLSPRGYFADSFNHSMLIESLLLPLGPNGSRHFRRAGFDFLTDSRIEAQLEIAAEDAILLFDGVFLLREELRDFWDFSVFVEASFENTVARAEARDQYLFGDAAAVRRCYAERYVPGQELYLQSVDPARLADMIIDNNDIAAPVLRKVPNPSFQRTPIGGAPSSAASVAAELKR